MHVATAPKVELTLLLKTHASAVVLTEGLELGPVLGELLRESVCRLNGAGQRDDVVYWYSVQ